MICMLIKSVRVKEMSSMTTKKVSTIKKKDTNVSLTDSLKGVLKKDCDLNKQKEKTLKKKYNSYKEER